jgi:pyridoxine 5-phosphate synthase
VPERRQEITTEGGLDAAGQVETLKPFIVRLRHGGIQVALFIDPDLAQVYAAREAGADAIEFHTGTYCNAFSAGERAKAEAELDRLRQGARLAASQGLEVHAGHGLDYENVGPVAAIPEIVELNIGHYLVGEAIFVGLADSVRRMRRIMDEARAGLRHSATELLLGGAR